MAAKNMAFSQMAQILAEKPKDLESFQLYWAKLQQFSDDILSPDHPEPVCPLGKALWMYQAYIYSLLHPLLLLSARLRDCLVYA
jgi:hypothetical protein